ncbi:YunC family protein [Methanohalobium sp.]|uniref:YunC family protein n=1 Tax=Methanohalobium sp. TaxID=2837493 RepID=UPI0025E672A7|nr:DUF1805 domain-containing protein [Methanohalobium sp.]
MIVEQVNLHNGTGLGLNFNMHNAPIIVIKADKGFVMCGYLDINAANKLDDAAAKVKGVNSFEDVLNAEIIEASQPAKEMGIDTGMTGKEALEKMF